MFDIEGIYFRETPEQRRQRETQAGDSRRFRIGEIDAVDWQRRRVAEQAAIDDLRRKIAGE